MRRSLIVPCTALLMLNACAGVLVSTGATVGESVAENRSLGRKVDDTMIYTDLTNQFVQADKTDLLSHVTFNVRYGRVMLTGRVKTQDDAMQATALAWKAKGVTEVINELIVTDDISFMDTANDALVKHNLESRLLITKGVWVINYSIDVQSGTAYLIGRVKDQAELDRVFSVARTTRGVKHVVSHLQINPDTQHPTNDPNAPQPSEPASSSNSAPVSSGNTDNASAPVSTSSGGSDVYTGPVYSSGSISSSDTPPASH